MSRVIAHHHLPEYILPQNEIVIMTDDDKEFNAHHRYVVHHHDMCEQIIDFQKGPVKEGGVNGLTEDCLLAILIDRL